MAQGFMEKRSNPKWVANNVSVSGIWGGTLWFLGFIFAILGIIADVNGTLGLTMMAWFMLAIVFHLAGLSFWISWAVGVYFRSK
jgi:hypothetical protein